MKKQFLITALTILVLLVAIGIPYYIFHKKVPVVETHDSTFSVLLENKTETYKDSTEWYDVSIIYPKDNQKVRDQIFEMWDAFAKESRLKEFKNFEEAKEELQLNAEGSRYTFYAEYKLAQSTSTLTYIYEIYTYTGGAHGATMVYPFTLNEKQEILPVEHILPTSSLTKVSKLAASDILKQKRARMKEFGMTEKDIDETLRTDTWLKEGTDATRDNYNSVWFDGSDIVINFGQYQVGPYAEGMYEVRIPKNQI